MDHDCNFFAFKLHVGESVGILFTNRYLVLLRSLLLLTCIISSLGLNYNQKVGLPKVCIPQ